jgi:hypothetical protein
MSPVVVEKVETKVISQVIETNVDQVQTTESKEDFIATQEESDKSAHFIVSNIEKQKSPSEKYVSDSDEVILIINIDLIIFIYLYLEKSQR